MTVDVGVGDCPKREDGLGHVWESWMVDPRKSCVHCGRPGRDNEKLGESGGYFAEATLARTELFDRVASPLSSHGKAKS
jgi:hypothetical protein